jgi:hypothetical protein
MMTSLMAVVRPRYLLSSVGCCTYRSSKSMHYPIGLFGNLLMHLRELLPNLSCSPAVIGSSSRRPWRNAVEFLKPQVRRGRPDDLSQSHLTTGLGELYFKYNPKIGRQVTGLEESGPFKTFVTLVVPPYRDFARMVGRTATVDNIVRRMSDRVNRQQAIEGPLGADYREPR